MSTFRILKACLFLLVVLAIVSAACTMGSAPGSTQGAPTIQPAPVKPTNTAVPTAMLENTATPAPTELPPPTETLVPTNTPVSTNTPVASPPGMSRSNPFPTNQLASLPNWDVQVLDVIRGEEAWKAIQAAYDTNIPAYEGMEYLLIKLYVKSTYADSEEHNITECNFSVTGDRLNLYTCGSAPVIGPKPELFFDLVSGGEAEGWIPFMVAQGEGNMILVFDEEMNFDGNSEWFIALDEGASASVSPDLVEIKPNDLGTDRSDPAPMNVKAITEDWEVTVLEVVRGDEAWRMVKEASSNNKPPASGMEFIAIKSRVRSINSEDIPQFVYGNGGLYAISGNTNVVYGDSPVMYLPDPALACYVYPGGECEGWSVFEIGVAETGLILIFQPTLDPAELNKRYLSLEE
jgi:hypothetical protein